MMTAQQVGKNIVSKAISHIGEREQPLGSNSGPEVNRYLEYAGVDTNLPAADKSWCASFASYIIGMTLLQMALQASAHPDTASSHEMVMMGSAPPGRDTATTGPCVSPLISRFKVEN